MKKLLLLLLLALPAIGEAQMCMQWELVCKDAPRDGEIVAVWIESDDAQDWEKAAFHGGRFYAVIDSQDVTKQVTNWMRIYPPASVCPAPTPPAPDGGEME